MRIGFIGLGLMGLPMAKNIRKAGFDLVVWNRTTAKSSQLKKLGAVVAKTPKELGSMVDVVITMVTGPKEVRQVLMGRQGVVSGQTKKGLVVIDMSTIGPQAAKDLAFDLKEFEIEFIDAPVTGSTPKAISGELTIFVGGDQKIFQKVKPVLQAMGTNIPYIGEVGMGQAIKLVNNVLVAATMTALAEGFLLADAEGLEREKVAEVLGEVPAISPFMKLKMPHMVKNEHPVLFSMANMNKDLKLALNELPKDQKLPVLKQVSKLYNQGVKGKLSNQDISAVLTVLTPD